MSVKVSKTENKNEVKLEFTVEAKIFDEGIKTVFNKNAKYFNIPGFRKGKAPMNIVEKYYGSEIFYEDAFNEIVPGIFDEAVKEEKLEVVSRPEIDIVQIGKGKENSLYSGRHAVGQQFFQCGEIQPQIFENQTACPPALHHGPQNQKG